MFLFFFSIFITYSPDQTSNPELTNSEFIKRKLTFLNFQIGFLLRNKQLFSLFLSILILKRKYCKFREINSEFVDSRFGVWSDEEVCKGQLNSEWIYEVIVSPKMPTKNLKDFCPGSLLEGRAEILQIFCWRFGRNDDLINSFWI